MRDARHELVKAKTRKIVGPEDAAGMFHPLFDDRRETFMALYLNARHRPIMAPYVVSVGSLNASLVHPREVFRPAVELGACAIIVAHNHPSGDVEPSGDDIALTERLKEAGDIMGIKVLDHLILNIAGYGYSMMGQMSIMVPVADMVNV